MTRTLIAPRVFSLFEAPEDTVAFLEKLRELVATPDLRMKIDLEDVTSIRPEAVAAFVAVMNPTHHEQPVSGNVPRDQECRQLLYDFGFFECVRAGPNLGAPAGTIRCEHSGQRVEGQVAKKIIDFGLQSLGRTERKHGPAYNVFTEAMANTFQHASTSARGVQRWWAAVYYDAGRKAACFTAVDTGVGILRSFNLQKRAEAWREDPRLAVRNQGEILQMLLSGEIRPRTGDRHRGRGLPNIKRACDAGRIRNLSILSNRALARVAHEDYRELQFQFRGTIIYSELVEREPREDRT